ncbi:MAG: hypothetical protein O2807_10790 [bacterium]|nr:hypothetical protein [bacterium]
MRNAISDSWWMLRQGDDAGNFVALRVPDAGPHRDGDAVVHLAARILFSPGFPKKMAGPVVDAEPVQPEGGAARMKTTQNSTRHPM